MTTRQEIAAVLDSVEGVTAYSSSPPTISPYCAWPNWISITWVNDYVHEHIWQVFLTLPGSGDETTINESDPMIIPVGEALWNLGHVDIAEPVLITTGTPGDTMPVLRYRLVTP